jgi:hypothetical protein
VEDIFVPRLLRDEAMTRSTVFACAGVVTTIIGFSKLIEPLIGLGFALVVIAMISNPTSKP